MTIDWTTFERAGKVVAGPGTRTDGASLLRLRSSVLSMLDDATAEVERESLLPATPKAEVLVVDRHAWIGGNVRTLEQMFGNVELPGAGSKLVAIEGGAFIGLVARAVLAQYDPYRDQLIVVYPNLGSLGDQEGLRFLLFHEVTHVAQFRAAPWMIDHIAKVGREVLSMPGSGQGSGAGWTRDAVRRLPEKLPEFIRWARDALEGKPIANNPLLDLLPEEQRASIMSIHALVTVLEGHATHVTDLIARRALPNYEELTKRIEARRSRPPLLRLLEAIAGLEMKRQQYVLGRAFCERVWEHGGAEALAPVWRGPEWVPTTDELRDPDRWFARVSLQTSA